MSDQLPASTSVLVIGAGVHGLSTAWHLAQQGEQVLVVDKTGIGAGASGIACGVVRNNYFQPAMQELMAACVEIWESEADNAALPPEWLHRAGAGRAGERPDRGARAPAADRLSVGAVRRRGRRHRAHALAVPRLARARADGLPARVRRADTPSTSESMFGLADLAQAAGAQILSGVEVTGFDFDGSGAVTSVSDESRVDRGRAGGRCGRALDRVAVGDARAAGRTSTSASPMGRSPQMCRCGRTGTCRRARSRSTPRRS